MRFSTPTTLALAVFAGAGCARDVDVAAEEAALRQITADWQRFEEERNAEGVAALFADDAVLIWEARGEVRGPDAIRAHMEEAFAGNPSGEGSWAPDHYRVAASGDLAVESGAYDGPDDSGRYVTVYEKIDGMWKIVSDVSLSTAPAGGAPAWAQEWLTAWYEAYNAREAQRLAAMYAPDARVGDARGRAAIARRFESGWADEDARCEGGYDGFEVSESIASGWGRDRCTTPDGTVIRSTWLAMYERQEDGTWLCIRDNGVDVE